MAVLQEPCSTCTTSSLELSGASGAISESAKQRVVSLFLLLSLFIPNAFCLVPFGAPTERKEEEEEDDDEDDDEDLRHVFVTIFLFLPTLL